MSWQASQWAVAQTAGCAAAKAVLMVLAEASKDGSCILSQATIAERAEVDRRTVVRQMRALEARGLIRRERRGNSYGHRTSDRIHLRLGDSVSLGLSDSVAPRDEALSDKSAHPYVTTSPSLSDTVAQEPVIEPVKNREERSAPARRLPETPIPEGFPDDAAIADAAALYRSEGWDIDASAQAEKFRLHALQHDRRLRNWRAGFQTWARKATTWPEAKRVAPLTAQPLHGDDWDQRVSAFKLNGFWNAQEWGPKPGKPGCLAPAQILAAYGFHVALVKVADRGSAA